MKLQQILRLLGAVACCALSVRTAAAHSASNAYLTLDVDPKAATVVRLQWDIALRDLDFVLKLDEDGNGDITWAELRGHQAAIGRYALQHLTILADGKGCPATLTKQLVGDHADGAYAVLFFEARCKDASKLLTLDYRLFFDVDPSHRAIVVAHIGAETATALMSPQNATIALNLPSATGLDSGQRVAPR